MYRVPSRRKKAKSFERLNLTPIMDAVFIFIFFLLMSANFIKIFEISSDVPIVSDSEPPKSKINEKPLALTLQIKRNYINIYTGLPSKFTKRIGNINQDRKSVPDLNSLHNYLIQLKKKYKSEKTIIFEPDNRVEYDTIVRVMDHVQIIKNTDEAIYVKDKKTGIDIRLKVLFNNIVFGNIQS